MFKHIKINGEQLFFPKYALMIFISCILLFYAAVTAGALMERYMPKYDETKSKPELIIEMSLQIGMIGVITYLFREIISKILRKYLGTHIHGSPEKYAIVVIAPTMFSQQQSLIDKIDHVWRNIRGDQLLDAD